MEARMPPGASLGGALFRARGIVPMTRVAGVKAFRCSQTRGNPRQSQAARIGLRRSHGPLEGPEYGKQSALVVPLKAHEGTVLVVR